jgi:DNA-binding beta-propeller fold protein YncE
MGEITKKKIKILFAFWMLSFFFCLPAFVEEEPFSKELNLLNKFGGLDVPSEQILANPCDIAISSKGFIYVLDSEDNNLKVFEKDGIFFKCIGRKGQGPGEFVRPWTVSIAEDNICITDTGNRRVQIFSKDGMYLRSYKVPVGYGVGLAFDEKGSLYLNTKGFRSPKLISAHDNQGNLLMEFGNLEGDLIEFYDFTQIKEQIKEGKIPDSFKNDILLITDRIGNLFAVHRALNKIKKFSPKGKLLYEEEIKADEYKNIYNSFLQKNASEESPSMFWALYYVNDLAMDESGNLYVLLNEPSRMVIYVYSSEGIFKGKLLGVKDSIFRIAISNDNSLYGLSQETHFIYKFKLPDTF